MKVIEYASGEPQICGALPEASVAITSNTVRPAILISAIPVAPFSNDFCHTWRASVRRLGWPKRTFILLTKDRRSTGASRLEEAANWLDESPVPPFKVLALSFVCAVIGPVVAVLIFVLVNNNWG